MHVFKTTLLTFALIAVLSTSTNTVSAQWVNEASPACQECLVTARNEQVPDCIDIPIPADPRGENNTKMSYGARVCQCGAANSNVWIQSCTRPDACDTLTASILEHAYRGPILDTFTLELIRNAQVPVCIGIPAGPREGNGNMTPQARSCQCGAANSDVWIQSCVKPDTCDNLKTSILKRAYADVKIGCAYSGASSAPSNDDLSLLSSSAADNEAPL
ncbi:hypothetical protein BGW39_004164 [Mortierella sp. 14UC]|nr:hypothetical protein BGW39_004164 [Mortierella sp. 14UC]